MVALAAVENVVRGFGRYNIIASSRRLEYQMRNDLFAHLEEMHLAYFQHQRIGDLMARLTNDLNAVRQMTGFGVLMGSSTSLVVVFTVISMLGVSVKLTLISLVLMPIASVTFAVIGRRVNQRLEQLPARFGDLSTKAQENFSGIRVVKAFSQEEAEIGSFGKVNRQYLDGAVDLAKVNGLIWPAMAFVLGVAVLSVSYIGGPGALPGRRPRPARTPIDAALNPP